MEDGDENRHVENKGNYGRQKHMIIKRLAEAPATCGLDIADCCKNAFHGLLINLVTRIYTS
jgi:hypothetical protein